MLHDIKNLKLYKNIDYVHNSDDMIYEQTFNNILQEHLIFHGKEIFIKELRQNYPDISKFLISPPFSMNKDIVCMFKAILNSYTVQEIDDIITKYSYSVSKISGDYIILRPINNYQQKFTNWYFHLSPREDLGKIGLKVKNSDIVRFERYESRIYLYPFFTMIGNDEDSIYKMIIDKAKMITARFNIVKHKNDSYYIYAVHLPEKFPIYRDTAQSRDYAVYVKNNIPAERVELIGEV